VNPTAAMVRRCGYFTNALLTIAVALSAYAAAAQSLQPRPDVPTPYRTIERWITMPAGRTMGSTSAIEVERDGRSVWVADRCGGASRMDSALAPILKFDPSGTLTASVGAGLFLVPHGIYVDRNGNIWVTDASDGMNVPRAKGHQVFKFTPAGRLLMIAIGKGKKPEKDPITAAVGVAADRMGNVYGAVVPTPGVTKHIRR